MDKLTLSRIAKMHKTSTTTVYNALYSRTPVNTKLKKEILNTAESIGYFAQNKVPVCDVAVILPSNPVYFWSEAEKGILNEIRNSNISIKLFTYSNMDDEEDFVLCMESAKRSNSKVYIITPVNTEKTIRIFNELDKNIVFLNEYVEIDKAGFVGADAYKDGQMLAQACYDFLKKHPRILIINTTAKNCKAEERKLGFCESLPESARITGEIKLPFNRTLAASIAREIEIRYQGKFDCIFVAQGWFQQVSMALKKLDLVIPCIGCENQKVSPKYAENGKLHAARVQHIRKQGEQSIKYAMKLIEGVELPGRNITVESTLMI